MKRGKSEEPFLPEGGGNVGTSDDDILKDDEEEEEESVMNQIMERRIEWSRRRNTDDCSVS